MATNLIGKRRTRRKVCAGCIALAGALLLAIVLFTPLAGALLLDPALSWVAGQYGLTATVSRFDLDVAQLRVTVEDLQLAAPDHPTEPFLTVDQAAADLPWSAAWQGLAIEGLSLTGVAVSMVGLTDGSSNLPAGQARRAAPMPRVPLAQLDVRDLTVDWRDDATGFVLHLPPTTIRLTSDGSGNASRGPVAMNGTGRTTWRQTATEISRLEGEIEFDGAALHIHQLALAGPEVTLTVGGSVDALLGRPRLALAYEARLDLARVASRRPGAIGAGDVALSGELGGTVDRLTATAVVAGAAIGWNEASAERLAAVLNLTPEAVTLDDLRLELAGGELAANGRVDREAGWAGQLEAAWNGLEVDRLLAAFSLEAPLTFAAAADGSLAASWPAADVAAATLSARARLRPGGRVDTGLRLEASGGRWRLDIDQTLGAAAGVSGTVEGVLPGAGQGGPATWRDAPVSGALAVDCGDLEHCSRLLSAWHERGVPLALRGNLAADIAIDGTLGRPGLSANLTGPAVAVGPAVLGDLAAAASVDRDGLRIAGARFTIGENEVSGDARIRWADGAIDGSASVAVTDLTSLFVSVPPAWAPSGTGRIDVTAGGTLDRVLADAGFVFEGAEIAGRHLGGITGRARLDAAEEARFDAEIPDLGARLEASLDLAAGEYPFVLRAEIRGGAIDRLLPPNIPATGRITLEATAVGRLDDLAGARVELRVDEAAGAIGTVAACLAQPAAAVYEAGALRIAGLEAFVGDSRLQVDGALSTAGDATLSARLAGDAGDLVNLATRAAGRTPAIPTITAIGDLSVELAATGPPDAIELTGDLQIDGGSVAADGYLPLTGVTARATLRDGLVRVDTLRAALAGAELHGTAELPLEIGAAWLPDAVAARFSARERQARLRAEIGSLSAALLAGYLDPATLAGITGSAAATIDLELPSPGLAAVRGRLTLPAAAFVVSGVPLGQRQPTAILVENGRAVFTSFRWGNDTSDVTVGGALRFGGGYTADLSLDGDLDLRAVGALAPALAAIGVASAGSARLRADISGPIRTPDVRGTVGITGGEVRIAEPRLVVTELAGDLALEGRRVTARNLTGSANGGQVEVTGGWTFGGRPDRNGFTVTGTGLALDVPSGLRSEADVDLRIAEANGDLALTGTVTLLRGAYREPLTLAGGLLEAFTQGPGVTTTGLDDGPGNLRLDVRIATGDDVVVENNYVDAELGGDLRLGGTLRGPAVTGRVTLREGGRIRFGNRVYEVDNGTVDFVDPYGIEPELTLTARTRAGAYDVTLSVAGARDALTTTFRSEPLLPESDIVSVLLTGRPLDQLTSSTAGARNQALGLVSSELLGQAGRRVGLDLRVGTDAPDAGGDIRFDSSLIAADLDPAARVTVGRNLRDDVRLLFSRSLRDNDLAWLVDYLPRSDFELRAFFDDQRARAYEFRHAVSVGGTPRAAAAASERRRPRVSGVELRGVAGADAARLRRRLSLRAGDRFDFHLWQRDRDRIETFFLERGFLEMQVRARREQQPEDGGVALTYDITRGPVTELAVTGFDLPDAVRRDLQSIWTRAVFDTFLIEELTARVTAHLARHGYLRAAVDTRVVETDWTKRVAIRITPGTRSAQRRLVFEGASAAQVRELRELVASSELRELAWTAPERLATAVTSLFRNRGWLRATTAVGEARFAGRVAELPVGITTGPLFHIGNVEVHGALARSAAAVRAAAALDAGGVYTEGAVAAARARIATSYRSAGHEAARVTGRSVVDDDAGRVNVRFDISEGPRQVVETVVIEGAPRTHPALVARALDLNPGAAVDPAAWNLARQRLYKTGVFRSVDIQARVRAPAGAGDTGGTVPVEARVTLEEWPPYRLRYGIRFSDEAAALGETTGRTLRIGAAGDASRRNLFGRGLTAGVSSRVDRGRQAVRAFLRITTLVGHPIETNLFASRRRDVNGARDARVAADVTTFTAEQRFQPHERLTFAYSANLDLNRTSDQAGAGALPFDDQLQIVRFNGSAVADSRDDLFNATTGFYHSSNLEYGDEVGRPLRFLKYLGQQFVYRRLGKVVLASAGRIGLATSYGGALIPTERFFAGGGNSVRGYAEDSLGPLGPYGTPAGGSALLILSQEARFPLWWRIAGVGFVDAGNVFASVRDISLRELRLGAGLGLRFDTPVGLLRVDYGLGLEQTPGRSRGRVFVSLGQAF